MRNSNTQLSKSLSTRPLWIPMDFSTSDKPMRVTGLNPSARRLYSQSCPLWDCGLFLANPNESLARSARRLFSGMWSQVQTNSEAQVFHQGYYPELYGITIDETGIYDFGSHNGSGSGQHQWKGSGQINVSGVIGLQVNPAWMVVGKVGGVRVTRRAGDDELGYMDGTNTLNAASQQLQSLSLNGMAFSIGLRKRITGGEEIERDVITHAVN